MLYFVRTTLGTDFTWDSFGAIFCGQVEVTLALMCFCIPSLRHLLRRIISDSSDSEQTTGIRKSASRVIHKFSRKLFSSTTTNSTPRKSKRECGALDKLSGGSKAASKLDSVQSTVSEVGDGDLQLTPIETGARNGRGMVNSTPVSWEEDLEANYTEVKIESGGLGLRKEKAMGSTIRREDSAVTISGPWTPGGGGLSPPPALPPMYGDQYRRTLAGQALALSVGPESPGRACFRF